MSQLEKFAESNFMIPDYVYHFVRAPISRMGFLYGIHKVTKVVTSPSLQDIHTFLSDLFTKALLSAECSIGKETLHGIRLCGQIPIHLSCICFYVVCLIYVERLMEVAFVPLVSSNWRPILLCGLLLASKVWQDLRCVLTTFGAY